MLKPVSRQSVDYSQRIVLRSNSGSFAMFAAIRLASSRVRRCAADSLVAGSTYFGTCLRLLACTYLRGVLVEYLGGLP